MNKYNSPDVCWNFLTELYVGQRESDLKDIFGIFTWIILNNLYLMQWTL